MSTVNVRIELSRNVPLDALRTLLTLLVVFHHAVLAYVQFAPPPPSSLGQPLLWGAFPIVDAAKWKGIDLVTSLDDTFFMALLFLVSGLFVPASLNRKGAIVFLRDRVRKLGLAFVAGAGLVAPLAYYATYRSLAPQTTSFWHQWLRLGVWPAGPAWFLWVLLAFDLAAAGLFACAAPAMGVVGRVGQRLGDRPLRVWALLVAVSGVAYVVLSSMVDPLAWNSFGPFFAQTARLPLYATYFAVGALLGGAAMAGGLLAAEGKLARRWGRWVAAALVIFAVAMTIWITIFAALARGPVGKGLITAGNVMYPLTCATTSFAVLALALRFLRRPRPLLVALTPSAFGIYVVHYAFVTWLQLALLRVTVAAPVKGVLVFVFAVLGSWLATAAARHAARVVGTSSWTDARTPTRSW